MSFWSEVQRIWSNYNKYFQTEALHDWRVSNFRLPPSINRTGGIHISRLSQTILHRNALGTLGLLTARVLLCDETYLGVCVAVGVLS